MTIRRGWRSLTALGIATAWLALAPAQTHAATQRAVGPTPPRLAFVDGEVSFWRTGADDWAPAQVNTPLAAGDSLYVGDGGNAEIEIGARAFVRAGSGTQLSIESLETGFLQLQVTAGYSALDLKRMPEGQVIEIDTPNGAFTIERPGYYRVDVNDDTVFTARRGGEATAIPASGEFQDIGSDERIVLSGAETATARREPAPELDQWDRWNFDRTAHLTERPRSAEYVPPPVAGIDDLDRYGEWRDTPRYGHVWVPREVAPDWAPYSTGRWVWDPYYEWTWVDEQPWGWAPYHYGRWCWNDGYWGWAPGPIVARPVYAPALVAFFDAGGVSVSVGVGAPVVSWVALGWGEPVVPWWGPPAFVGRPYWGGWGGPRVVNNVVINNTTIVNVRNVNRFSNVDVRNAVIGVPRDHFGRGGNERIRFDRQQAESLRPVRGAVGVRPVSESLMPRRGRAQAPPERIQNRRVVATRRPEDTTRRLRAAGLEPRGPARPAEPRIVRPTDGRDRGGRRERERGDSMTPPPAPGREPRPGDERRRGGAPNGDRQPGVDRGPNADGARDAERGPKGGRDRGVERAPNGDRVPGVDRGPGAEGERGNRRGPRSQRDTLDRAGNRSTSPPPPGDRPANAGAAGEDRRGHRPANERGRLGEDRPADADKPGEAGKPRDEGRRGRERGGVDAHGGRDGVPPPPPDGVRGPANDRRHRGGGEVSPAERRGPDGERGPRAVPPPGDAGAPSRRRDLPSRETAPITAPPRQNGGGFDSPDRGRPPLPDIAPQRGRRGGSDGGDVQRGRSAAPPQDRPMQRPAAPISPPVQMEPPARHAPESPPRIERRAPQPEAQRAPRPERAAPPAVERRPPARPEPPPAVNPRGGGGAPDPGTRRGGHNRNDPRD